MLSIYAKWKGVAYLKDTLQGVVERLMITMKDMSLELDPTRVSSAEELETNVQHLQIVAKVFIDNICDSVSETPASFRQICSLVSLHKGPLLTIVEL
jgi:neurofibromin 1